MIDVPIWFQRAYAEHRTIEDLWGAVLFEGFSSFSFNRSKPGFDPETCWGGNFNPAFDQQPGISWARARNLELETPERAETLRAYLKGRGIVVESLPPISSEQDLKPIG